MGQKEQEMQKPGKTQASDAGGFDRVSGKTWCFLSNLLDSQVHRSPDTLVVRGKEESPEPFRSGAQVFDFLAVFLADL